MSGKLFVLGGLLGGLAGCIGTDLVDEMLLPVETARIEVTPSNTALILGTTADFEATYYDANGDAVPDIVFAWFSSNPEVAAIDAAGRVDARQTGQVMIQAEAQGITSAPSLLTVVADPNQVARVAVMPDTVILEQGGSAQLTATAYTLNDEALSGVTITWQSSDDEVAAVDATGQAVALQPGTTAITATADGVTSPASALIVRGQQRTGTFRKRPGTTYNVAGTATLEELSNGRLRLSFSDDFLSSNGPGLEVFLSTQSTITASSHKVGALKQTSGAQTYDLPSSVGLNDFHWVVIHCVPFNVTFGYAELR